MLQGKKGPIDLRTAELAEPHTECLLYEYQNCEIDQITAQEGILMSNQVYILDPLFLSVFWQAFMKISRLTNMRKYRAEGYVPLRVGLKLTSASRSSWLGCSDDKRILLCAH